MAKLKRPFHTTIIIEAADITPRYMESELYGVAFYKTRPPIINITGADLKYTIPQVRDAIKDRFPEHEIIELDGAVPEMPEINYKRAPKAKDVWAIVTGMNRENHYEEIRRFAENGVRVILVC